MRERECGKVYAFLVFRCVQTRTHYITLLWYGNILASVSETEVDSNMRVKHSKNSVLNRRKAQNKYGTINEMLTHNNKQTTGNFHWKIRIRAVF